MFSARSVAIDTGCPQYRSAAGKNAAIRPSAHYFALKVRVICAAALTAGR
jgi:hypothetical protein